MVRKFLTFYATPLVASILILIKIKEVDEFLVGINKNAPIYIGVVLVVLTIVNHVITVISPYRKYERIANNKWVILDSMIESFIDKYASYRIQANIMKPEWRFLYKIEPTKKNNKKRKVSLAGRVFKVIWCYEMHKVNKNLRITTNQGVCGSAYRDGNGVKGAALLPIQEYNFNFSGYQNQLTKDLVMVASCPIFSTEISPEQKKQKVIAVLNVESKVSGSDKLILDQDLRSELDEEMLRLSDFISKLEL